MTKCVYRMFVCLAIITLLAPVSFSTAAVSKDVVRIGVSIEPSTINPMEIKMGYGYPVLAAINEGLIMAHPNTMMLTYTGAIPNGSLIAAAVQQYLQNVGITVNVRQLEEGTGATYFRNKDPRIGALLLYSWAGNRDPSIRMQMSISSKGYYTAVSKRTKQQEIDELVADQAREMDPKKRLALRHQLHDLLRDDAIGSSLFGLNMIYAVNTKLDYSWMTDSGFFTGTYRIRLK